MPVSKMIYANKRLSNEKNGNSIDLDDDDFVAVGWRCGDNKVWFKFKCK